MSPTMPPPTAKSVTKTPCSLEEFLAYACYYFPRLNKEHKPPTPEQCDDLAYLYTHRKVGLLASRGYGKTLLVVLFDSYFALKRFKVVHRAHRDVNLEQYYDGFERLKWHVTKWHVDWGQHVRILIGLYEHGRGPRCDLISNDECGTVILPRDCNFFYACQDMLSGSALGRAVYIGTQDPNSLWSKIAPDARCRGYDSLAMPWVTMQYNYARKHRPAWYMDQEYHMKATPAGGLLWPKCTVQAHSYQTKRFGIDSNPEEGYFVVGSHQTDDALYICEAHVFTTLRELALFMVTRRRADLEFELEMNGPGAVVGQYLDENDIPYIKHVVTEQNKIQRCAAIACKPVVVPPELEYVYKNCIKQIWNKEKKIEKFSDAHWFDATWHSATEEIVWT